MALTTPKKVVDLSLRKRLVKSCLDYQDQKLIYNCLNYYYYCLKTTSQLGPSRKTFTISLLFLIAWANRFHSFTVLM